MWDWVALIDPDFMLSVVTCDQYGGWSDTGYCDKSYDEHVRQQQLTPNQAKRRAIVWKMQSVPAAQKPYIWLAHRGPVSARVAEAGRGSSTRRRGRSTRSRS